MEEARCELTQDSDGFEWQENTLRNVNAKVQIRHSNGPLGSPRVQGKNPPLPLESWVSALGHRLQPRPGTGTKGVK